MRARHLNLLVRVDARVSKIIALLTFSLVTFVTSTNTTFAGANLMLSPSRIVFEERMRTAQVTLLNTGDKTGSYRISFVRQQMTESGQFIKVEPNESGLYSDPMVRYSPRQIILPAGQAQVIRLMLRKPRDLEQGEYRSHMLFQTIPEASKSSLETAISSSGKGITIEIIPVIGISIPVIVRHGKLKSSIRLENAHIVQASETNPKPHIALEMHRSGNQSVYGDFRAIFTPKGEGEPVTIGLVNGVAVYTPNTRRKYFLPLNIPQEVSLEDGQIRIIYLESGKDEKTGLIAETNFPL